jgi:hypothetical protein
MAGSGGWKCVRQLGAQARHVAQVIELFRNTHI